MIKVTINIDDSDWDDEPVDLYEFKKDIRHSLNQGVGIPLSDMVVELERV